jgi:hypothetical protein
MFVSEVIRWWQVRWHGIQQPWNPRQLREAIVSACESSEFSDMLFYANFLPFQKWQFNFETSIAL